MSKSKVAVTLFAAFLCCSANSLADSYQINGLDAHDGKIVQFNGTYYLYGTRYGLQSSPACLDSGFAWFMHSPWCGFGVWTTKDKVNWHYQGTLFDPLGGNTASPIAPGESWQTTCTDDGCFNPRMVRRTSDGVWILWFNAPGDYRRASANAYYVMVCAGPAGPCGPNYPAPRPHRRWRGSTHKPRLWICSGNGDFDIVDAGAAGAYIVCTMPDQTLSIEKLDMLWSNGVRNSGESNVAGLTGVEAPSVFGAGPYLYLTYSSPNCAYCSSDGTGWARTSGGMLGTWIPSQSPLSGSSCSGQPRTIELFDGLVWEWVDQWSNPDVNGSQAGANIHLEGIHVDTNGNILPFGC